MQEQSLDLLSVSLKNKERSTEGQAMSFIACGRLSGFKIQMYLQALIAMLFFNLYSVPWITCEVSVVFVCQVYKF